MMTLENPTNTKRNMKPSCETKALVSSNVFRATARYKNQHTHVIISHVLLLVHIHVNKLNTLYLFLVLSLNRLLNIFLEIKF